MRDHVSKNTNLFLHVTLNQITEFAILVSHSISPFLYMLIISYLYNLYSESNKHARITTH